MGKFQRKLREQPKAERHSPPKWHKYAVLAAACLAVSISTHGSLERSGTPAQTRASKSAVEPPTRKNAEIPPAKIKIADLKLPTPDRRFSRLDSDLTSLLKSNDSLYCPFNLGLEAQLDDTILGLKKSLEAKGHRIFRNLSSAPEVAKRLHDYYLKNNIYLTIRNVTVTNRLNGTSKPIACLFRFPITGKKSLSFSYLGGRISAERIPVHYLSGLMPEQGAFMGGVTVRAGLLIFRDTYNDKRGADALQYDVILHEGIHYNTMIREGGWDFGDDMYFDANAKTEEAPEKTLSRSRDELRAYLIQAMYGRDPRYALELLMRPRMKQYAVAQKVLMDNLEKMLEGDQVRSDLFMRGQLPSERLTTDEIRQLAYRTFIDKKL
ncbi:MAG: hypothetical protein PHF60_03920 [Candidatus ainarchaeum sp.]|nr:hypothetical protein [Candidatus ainarchaeum sp.]